MADLMVVLFRYALQAPAAAAAPAAPAALTEQQREQLKQLTMKEPVMVFMKVRVLHLSSSNIVCSS
jgi:hypothetical protein